MINPVSKKNLVHFKRGADDRRNRKGRPARIPALDTLLAEVLSHEKNGETVARLILQALANKACRGDVRAAEVLLERGYGKVREEFTHSVKGEVNHHLISQVEIVKTFLHHGNDNGSPVTEAKDSRGEQS